MRLKQEWIDRIDCVKALRVDELEQCEDEDRVPRVVLVDADGFATLFPELTVAFDDVLDGVIDRGLTKEATFQLLSYAFQQEIGLAPFGDAL
jgi:hypothetical protein